jgi:heme-degrading monooxygenase HmoA
MLIKPFMKKLSIALLALNIATVSCTSTKKGSSSAVSKIAKPSASTIQQNPFYEMRTYYAAPGKLEDLNTRFRNNTMRIFAKHGMVNVGYWMPVENPDNKLIYILSYPSREARNLSWKAFGSDPEWQAVAKASEANGKLVAKAESVFMENTDYSPAFKDALDNSSGLVELRTYTASAGNIDNLHDRFRNHTLGLFKKHGISNIAYFKPTDEKQKDQLIYLIAHKDKPAADASWKAFREDPEWVKAKAASEVKGGGSLTTNVASVYMVPTDYSPLK